uniref:Rad60/SUMO-like domain-containing protein n=1 Tax=Myotis lucifugus TaxID=59463 RepID=G1Q034_MYOLU
MADENPKEGVKTENQDHINLKVAGQDGSVVQFKIKRHAPLSNLMKAYCERTKKTFSIRKLQFGFNTSDYHNKVTDVCAEAFEFFSTKWPMKNQVFCNSSKPSQFDKNIGTIYPFPLPNPLFPSAYLKPCF